MPGVWAMQDQNLDGVIAGLEAAWAFFDGMSQRLVTGNFPATAVRLGPLHPVLTGGFPEYAQHRGFIVGPARTGHRQESPRWKGTCLHARERFLRAPIATVWPT